MGVNNVVVVEFVGAASLVGECSAMGIVLEGARMATGGGMVEGVDRWGGGSAVN